MMVLAIDTVFALLAVLMLLKGRKGVLYAIRELLIFGMIFVVTFLFTPAILATVADTTISVPVMIHMAVYISMAMGSFLLLNFLLSPLTDWLEKRTVFIFDQILALPVLLVSFLILAMTVFAVIGPEGRRDLNLQNTFVYRELSPVVAQTVLSIHWLGWDASALLPEGMVLE